MIRLEEVPFELDGKTYKLRCNMNVLADAQEFFDGDFSEAIGTRNTFKSVTVFLTAMLNDYAEEMGWEERFTPRQLGRRLQKNQVPAEKIMKLVARSMTTAAGAAKAAKAQSTDTPEDGQSGN